MQLTLGTQETQKIDLQRIVADLGQYVSFKPDWALSPWNHFAQSITRGKLYEVLGIEKRYDSFKFSTGEPLPYSKVDGVLVTIMGDDGKEHQFGHDWFVKDSSVYKI